MDQQFWMGHVGHIGPKILYMSSKLQHYTYSNLEVDQFMYRASSQFTVMYYM